LIKWGGPKDFEWVNRMNSGRSSQAGLFFLVFCLSSISRSVLEPLFRLTVVFSDTSSLPRSKRDYMEALSPWDRAWLGRVDLNKRRKLVADRAISAYKTVVLCTMMAGYEMVPRDALKRPTDDMSCLLEEGDK